MPMEKLTSDPTLWANSLQKTATLFGFDGVVLGLDFSLMAEACGGDITWKNDRPLVMSPKGDLSSTPEQNGRMRHALEAAHRLFDVCRSQFACVATLTGPVTLASQLFGKDEGPNRIREVKQLVVQTAEAFCKTRPDVLIFLEGQPLALKEPEAIHRRVYNTLKNIAGHYDIPVGLYLQGYDPSMLNRFSSLKMDIYIPGPSREDHLPPFAELLALGEDSLGVGLGLPLDDFDKARGLIRQGLQHYRAEAGPGLFFTSFGPTKRDVNLENLHELVAEICKL